MTEPYYNFFTQKIQTKKIKKVNKNAKLGLAWLVKIIAKFNCVLPHFKILKLHFVIQ
jgi:hypothetical protein